MNEINVTFTRTIWYDGLNDFGHLGNLGFYIYYKKYIIYLFIYIFTTITLLHSLQVDKLK
jgi:hypothetical protein